MDTNKNTIKNVIKIFIIQVVGRFGNCKLYFGTIAVEKIYLM